MEILHEVLANYGKSVLHGHKHIYQSMPRMLTIWFEYGNYCSANPAHSGNKACHLLLSAVPAAEAILLRDGTAWASHVGSSVSLLIKAGACCAGPIAMPEDAECSPAGALCQERGHQRHAGPVEAAADVCVADGAESADLAHLPPPRGDPAHHPAHPHPCHRSVPTPGEFAMSFTCRCRIVLPSSNESPAEPRVQLQVFFPQMVVPQMAMSC